MKQWRSGSGSVLHLEVDAHEQTRLHDDLSRRMAYQVPQLCCHPSFYQVWNGEHRIHKCIVRRTKLLRYGYDPDRYHWELWRLLSLTHATMINHAKFTNVKWSFSRNLVKPCRTNSTPSPISQFSIFFDFYGCCKPSLNDSSGTLC